MPDTNPPEPLGGAKVFQEFFRKHLLSRTNGIQRRDAEDAEQE